MKQIRAKLNSCNRWECETLVQIQDDLYLYLLTTLRYTGKLITTAQVGIKKKESSVIPLITRPTDYVSVLIESTHDNITAELVEIQHSQIDQFAILEKVKAHYQIV